MAYESKQGHALVEAQTIPRVAIDETNEFLVDVINGLRSERKRILSKYFYDDAGCALFGKITKTDEYYVTRAETQCLSGAASDIARICADTDTLVELGGGNGMRSQIVKRALPKLRHYVPVDIADAQIRDSAQGLSGSAVKTTPLRRDFTKPFLLPPEAGLVRLGYIPGSTIGNWDPSQAIQMLGGLRTTLGSGARLLVTVDLEKSTERLEWAYNDAAGHTAEFNMNLLRRINRELAATFDTDNFSHFAFYNELQSRIEMHLLCLQTHVVTIAGQNFQFEAGETIHTENSYKYAPSDFRDVASAAGWESVAVWLDEHSLVSIHLLEAPATR